MDKQEYNRLHRRNRELEVEINGLRYGVDYWSKKADIVRKDAEKGSRDQRESILFDAWVEGKKEKVKDFERARESLGREIDEFRSRNPQVREPPICFVATVVYGDPEAAEVRALRRFRDDVLSKTYGGRLFINFYYGGLGEGLARAVQNVPSVIPLIKRGLDTIAKRYIEPLETI